MTKRIPSKNKKISLSKTKFTGLVTVLFITGSVFGIGVYLTLKGNLGEERAFNPENATSRSANIVAVRSNGTGIVAKLTVETSSGNGSIWVDTRTLIGFNFQHADITAVTAAARLAGVKLDDDGEGIANTGVHFIVSSGQEVKIQAVEGPSAGAAAAVITYAAIENKTVNENVVITGTISEDGSIGIIGGVAAKAQAAEKRGKDMLLVPEGQYVTVYEKWGLFTIRRRKPISYLKSYADNHGWGLEIREVSTLEEAADLMLT